MATPEEIEARLAELERQQDAQDFARKELLARQATLAELYGDMVVKVESGNKLLLAVRADQSTQFRMLQSMETELLDHRERLSRLETGLGEQGRRLDRVEGRLEGVEGRLGGVQAGVDEILSLLTGGAGAPA